MHNLENVKLLTGLEASYIAGFLDGDGCIFLDIKRRNQKEGAGIRHEFHFHPIVGFANNRSLVLQWILDKCGGFGKLHKKYTSKLSDRSLELKFSASTIRWLLPQIEPFLIIKKECAQLMIEYVKMTSKIRGAAIKTEQWLQNMRRYLEIYERIRCLNNDLNYSIVFKKPSELRENPESHEPYNVLGNEERERYKKFMDWMTRSQAYLSCVQYLHKWDGSETRD